MGINSDSENSVRKFFYMVAMDFEQDGNPMTMLKDKLKAKVKGEFDSLTKETNVCFRQLLGSIIISFQNVEEILMKEIQEFVQKEIEEIIQNKDMLEYFYNDQQDMNPGYESRAMNQRDMNPGMSDSKLDKIFPEHNNISSPQQSLQDDKKRDMKFN